MNGSWNNNKKKRKGSVSVERKRKRRRLAISYSEALFICLSFNFINGWSNFPEREGSRGGTWDDGPRCCSHDGIWRFWVIQKMICWLLLHNYQNLSVELLLVPLFDHLVPSTEGRIVRCMSPVGLVQRSFLTRLGRLRIVANRWTQPNGFGLHFDVTFCFSTL